MVEESPRPPNQADWDEHLRETNRQIPTDNPRELLELDIFRRHWEVSNPPTKTDGFTSQLPKHQRELMLRDRPGDYYAGLPKFAQVYYYQRCECYRFNGRLDDAPPDLIKAYVSRKGKPFWRA